MSTLQSSFTRRAKLKQVVTATGAALAIITLSACGGASESATAPESSVSAPASSAATEAPVETTAPTVTVPTEVNGIPVKGPAQNVHGKYLQTTLKADDPILQLDMNLVTGDNFTAFTGEEIKEALRVVSVFTAEEGIDSILNGSNDPADVDAWWAANKGKIAPKWHDTFYNNLKAGTGMVVRSAWGKGNPDNLEYFYDENSSRIQIRENKINNVSIESKYPNTIGITTDLDYIIWGKNAAGEKYPINVKGYAKYYVQKDDTTGGEWLIVGEHNQYEGFVSNK